MLKIKFVADRLTCSSMSAALNSHWSHNMTVMLLKVMEISRAIYFLKIAASNRPVYQGFDINLLVEFK